ncbi:hypothetical protein FRC09_006356 [Ceratobasidium sp. 395]|nr:hypothetical protein FRC09_006356 [Ceratobasidium sp. 395]
MPNSPQSAGSVSPTGPPVSLPLAIPEAKPAVSSPASSVSSSLPTPLSASFVAPSNFGSFPGPQSAAGAVRRKPSRRANTAERRATHNAVERARRETLNSRFLDLAALLPNLVSVRRPSKSAIVNSSIALIHTQRRARATAGRELRNLKAETDTLRRQLNEWRERACLAPVEEPMRNAEFLALIALEEEDAEEGEEERAAYAMMEMERGMGGGGYGMRDGDDDGEDGFGPDDVLGLESTSPPQPPSAPTMPLAPSVQLGHMHGSHLPHPLRMMPNTGMHGYPGFDAPSFDSSDAEKLAAWNSHIYTALQWQAAQAQAQAALFTPPGSAHGQAPPFPSAALAFQQQQRGMIPTGFPAGQMEEDASSAGDQASHRGSPTASHAGTQTGFDELAVAAYHQQAQQTRAARSASLSSFGAPPPMRKHASQGHVPQVGGVGGPFAPMGLLI